MNETERAAQGSDLDALLAGEDPDVITIDKTHTAPTEYRAHLYDRGSSWQLTGTGATRTEAVRNAVVAANAWHGAARAKPRACRRPIPSP